MKYSEIYSQLHKKIVDHKVLNEEELELLKKLSEDEKIELLKVYNQVINLLVQAGILFD